MIQNNEKSINELQLMIKEFCAARDWDQFHPIKDLAIGISTEANELLDLFRFKTDNQINQLMENVEFREKVQQELADVFFFILRISQMNNINLTGSLESKMKLNAKKYPIETSKGSNRKYNET